ncbi:MAG: hypothetical protein QGH37_18075 [Candidatus Poribacteria bacterium]|jgi:hypothetical protein|nr:hypothetical protein [Candidatus Poribacteria bacterium]MDP6962241.1 hypothetical protein [Dehalococcoidia bacterium]
MILGIQLNLKKSNGEIELPGSHLLCLNEALQPCLHTDIWSDDNVEQGAVLLKACLGEPCEGDDSMIPYELTRRRNRRIEKKQQSIA